MKSQENTKIQGKKLIKEKNNAFYQDLMLSHFFASKLKDEERDRFSKFLMNDWVNKLIFDRKINETGAISDFLDNSHEIETLRKSLLENKEIRDKFQNFFNKIDKTEFFHPQNLLNKFRESININHANSMKKTLKFSSLNRYLSSKNYTSRDQDFQISNSALKSLKTRNIKKKRKIKKLLNKESLWEIKDSIIEYSRLVKELGHIFSIEFFMKNFQSRAFNTTGSYVYMKFVKRGKIAFIEKMIKENPKLPFEFDLLGETGLHIACECGFSDIVDLLIKNNARINMRDVAGRTPLYFAARNNDHKIVSILFRNGARPWSTGKCDYRALEMNSIVRDLFAKAKKVDLIRKITKKRLCNKEWEKKLVDLYFE